MPIQSPLNQYQGINAHYQSIAQNELRGWKPFHSTFTISLMYHIQNILPEGYSIEPEDSLQIQFRPQDEDHPPTRPNPDMVIWQRRGSPATASVQSGTEAIPWAEKSREEVISSEENDLTALIISHEDNAAGTLIPVTRIEVISPTNKIEEKEFYRRSRDFSLASGISVVDIDLLHESSPALKGVPSYKRQEPDAYPYNIIVSEGKGIGTEKTRFYGFGIDENLPPIRIPLAGQDSILIEIGSVYTSTFQSVKAFTNKIDYSREPVHFEAYSREDQQRIWGRMLAVIEAVQNPLTTLSGANLLDTGDPALQFLQSADYQYAVMLVDENTRDCWWLLHQRGKNTYQLSLLSRQKTSHRVIMEGDKKGTTAFFKLLVETFDNQGIEAFLQKIG